jgi:hypothetical protein
METTLKSQKSDVSGPAPQPLIATVPLCVDLDGTLVKSDTFHDSLSVLARTHPSSLFRIPGWLLSGGKARVKAEVAVLAPLDAAHLPYNHVVLHFLAGQHQLGRPIYLATGADASLANRVARHLSIFSGVLASNGAAESTEPTGSVNLTGNHKLAALQQRFPAFDYIGNARPDLPALAHSRQAYIANPTQGLLLAMKARKLNPVECFRDR